MKAFEKERDFAVAGGFLTAERALAEIEWATVGVLIVDIELPGMSGIDLVARLSGDYPHLQIIIFTIAEDRPTVLSAIKRGACGYLIKGLSSAGLVSAVRECLAGGAPMTPKIAREIIRELQPVESSQTRSGSEILSEREQEILKWIALGHSRKQIAQTVSIAPSTVHTHIKNIYVKLQAHNRTQALNRARDIGML
jgi:DNA-binding NarL/FixJ family response regulator